MTTDANKRDSAQENEFAQTADTEQVGFFAEFWDFLLHNKKWWITPILVVLMIVGVLVIMGSTTAAPFIYTLF